MRQFESELKECDGDLMCLMPESLYNIIPHERQSHLNGYEKSPAHYQLKKNKTFSSEAMKIGTATHIRVLYGEEAFKLEVAEIPEFFEVKEEDGSIRKIENKRTKEWKEQATEWKEQNEGKICLPSKEYQLAKILAHNILVHPKIAKKFTGGIAEVSCFTVINGIPVKCRLDYWHPDKGIIVDLKTSRDVATHSFLKSTEGYFYDVQASSYCEIVYRIIGVPQSAIIVAIEKTPPFVVKRFLIDNIGLEVALNMYMKWIKIHKECLVKNNWSLADPDIEVLKTRQWMRETS